MRRLPPRCPAVRVRHRRRRRFREQAASRRRLDGGALDGVPIADSFVLPLDRFARQAAVGIVNVATDYAGTPRLAPMVFRTADRIEASFPLQAASLALDAPPVFEPGPRRSWRPAHRDRFRTAPADRLLRPARHDRDGQRLRRACGNSYRPTRSQAASSSSAPPSSAAAMSSRRPSTRFFRASRSSRPPSAHLVAGDGPIRNGATRLADAAVAVSPADAGRRAARLAPQRCSGFLAISGRRHPLARRQLPVLQQWHLAERSAAA